MQPGNQLQSSFPNGKVKSWDARSYLNCRPHINAVSLFTGALVWRTLFQEATQHSFKYHLHACQALYSPGV